MGASKLNNLLFDSYIKYAIKYAGYISWYRRRLLSLCTPVANYVPTVHYWTRHVLVFVMILRQCLHERSDLVIPISFLDFQSSTLELAVFLIGVLLFFECLLSLVSMAHVVNTLKSQQVNRAQLQDVALGVEAFAIVCLMPYSILHSVWLFMFVRQKWISTFPKPVQALHLIPTSLILLHTIVEGALKFRARSHL